MSRRRTVGAFFEDLAAHPDLRAAVEGVLFDGVMPHVRRAARHAQRAVHFPNCMVSVEPSCRGTGVGRCYTCNRPFCAHHGLLLIGPQLDPFTLVMEIARPTVGLCAPCANVGVKAAQQEVSRDTGFGVGGFASTGHMPPPPPSPQPEPVYNNPYGHGPEPYAQGYAPPVSPIPSPVDLERCWALVTLGLPEYATELDIKRAYKELSKQAHPDVPGGSHEAMANLNKAKSILEERKRG